ncbi:hypothetical protein F8M41_024346 [Gigaspora margarita]|uniref:Uncharacterized protein n=1 Tax=Gigaspora margarita TaxID=4874 RepID=A0A8H3XKC3_GIGMA|nr:hypothetical protein F8M41_024346 [Gigaspora margarita]
MNKCFLIFVFIIFITVNANSPYSDCKVFNSDAPVSGTVFWEPDIPNTPAPLGSPMIVNYTVNGINSTTTSTYLSVGFFHENEDTPFDTHRWQIESGLTDIEIIGLYVSFPLITQQLAVIFILADAFNVINCIVFPRFNPPPSSPGKFSGDLKSINSTKQNPNKQNPDKQNSNKPNPDKQNPDKVKSPENLPR